MLGDTAVDVAFHNTAVYITAHFHFVFFLDAIIELICGFFHHQDSILNAITTEFTGRILDSSHLKL